MSESLSMWLWGIATGLMLGGTLALRYSVKKFKPHLDEMYELGHQHGKVIGYCDGIKLCVNLMKQEKQRNVKQH